MRKLWLMTFEKKDCLRGQKEDRGTAGLVMLPAEHLSCIIHKEDQLVVFEFIFSMKGTLERKKLENTSDNS